MTPRAVLLDFDGVVVASLPLHLACWVDATQEVFRRPLPDPESLVGHGTRAISGIIAKRLGDPSLGATLVRVKQRLLSERLGGVPLVAGAREFVQALGDLGIPHGIASNSPGAFVRGALQQLKLPVKEVICGDEVSRGKPDPDIFWQLANRLRVEPQERSRVLVFEDSVHGLKAAVAAGMTAIGVATERPEKVLTSAGAVAVCADLGDALRRGWLVAAPFTSGA